MRYRTLFRLPALALLLAGCGEKQAFKPIVFVAGHSADSLTNAAGERLQGDPELEKVVNEIISNIKKG